jgi:hypothetical protein
MGKYETPMGDYVECDMCGKDFTRDPAPGGFLFGGKGVGPCCADRLEATAKRYGEERYIVAHCPEGVSFADWVRRDLRGGQPAVITVLTDQDADDYLRGEGQ